MKVAIAALALILIGGTFADDIYQQDEARRVAMRGVVEWHYALCDAMGLTPEDVYTAHQYGIRWTVDRYEVLTLEVPWHPVPLMQARYRSPLRRIFGSTNWYVYYREGWTEYLPPDGERDLILALLKMERLRTSSEPVSSP